MPHNAGESSYYQQNPMGIAPADNEVDHGRSGGLLASTEEAAVLAEGVGTALEWYARNLREETKRREALEEQLHDALHEADSQKRRADSLQRLQNINESFSDTLEAQDKKRSSSSSSTASSVMGFSSKFRSSSGASEEGQWQDLLMETHREIRSLHEDLERERTMAVATTTESDQKLRELTKAKSQAEEALGSAKEELKRQKDIRTNFERQQTRFVKT